MKNKTINNRKYPISKQIILLYFILVFAANVSAQQRPNIILLIGDDISRDDIGAYGRNPLIHTPNIDRLAKNGFLFNSFFVTSSSCSPSRTSLLTGRYPHNTGAPELHDPLPASQIYFPELLKKSGYFTALLGKWHEGENTRRAYDTLITGVPLNGDGGENKWVNILQMRPKDKPFFLWLASFDAHRDWDNAPQFAHSPDSVLIPITLVDAPATRKDLASYYSEIERLDFYIGKVLSELDRQHIADNTIIVFLGDNGRPFPGDKTRLNDRGTNTPFIVYIPTLQSKSRSVDALVSGIDVAPTLLQIAHVAANPNIQGKSFLPLLENGKNTFRHFVFTEHNWHDYQAYERAVRTKDYLYIRNWLPQLANQGPLDAVNSPSFKDLIVQKGNKNLTNIQADIFQKPRNAEELYVLKNDTAQLHNVIDDNSYRKIGKSLRSTLSKWQQETGDDFPSNLTQDWYGRENGETLPVKGVRGILPGEKSGAQRNNNKSIF